MRIGHGGGHAFRPAARLMFPRTFPLSMSIQLCPGTRSVTGYGSFPNKLITQSTITHTTSLFL